MRINLMLKLMGAFAAVIFIGAVVISVMTSWATQNAFTLYSTRNGQAWAQQLASSLEGFYSKNRSWQGVDAFLQSSRSQMIEPGLTGAGRMMGSASEQGRGMGFGRQAGSVAGMRLSIGGIPELSQPFHSHGCFGRRPDRFGVGRNFVPTNHLPAAPVEAGGECYR